MAWDMRQCGRIGFATQQEPENGQTGDGGTVERNWTTEAVKYNGEEKKRGGGAGGQRPQTKFSRKSKGRLPLLPAELEVVLLRGRCGETSSESVWRRVAVAHRPFRSAYWMRRQGLATLSSTYISS